MASVMTPCAGCAAADDPLLALLASELAAVPAWLAPSVSW